nr:MAG TPA: hypothetical protein [Caudoviricetes sp.]
MLRLFLVLDFASSLIYFISLFIEKCTNTWDFNPTHASCHPQHSLLMYRDSVH